MLGWQFGLNPPVRNVNHSTPKQKPARLARMSGSDFIRFSCSGFPPRPQAETQIGVVLLLLISGYFASPSSACSDLLLVVGKGLEDKGINSNDNQGQIFPSPASSGFPTKSFDRLLGFGPKSENKTLRGELQLITVSGNIMPISPTFRYRLFPF